MVLSYSVRELMRTARQPIQAKSTQYTRCTSGDAVTGAKAWTEKCSGACQPFTAGGAANQGWSIVHAKHTHPLLGCHSE